MGSLPTPADVAKWPAPNYIDPVTRRPLVLGVEIPLTVLTILFTAGRFYSRTAIVKALGWDDWFMLAATVRILSLQAHISFQELTKHVADSFNSNEYNDLYINASSVSDWVPSLRPTT
jgi:hypothetical protein